MRPILITISILLFSSLVFSSEKKQGNITYANGAKYKGELKDGMPKSLPPEISQSFVMLNLSSIEDQYFIDMATDAESKMASLKAKTLLIIYPLGEFVSNRPPIGFKGNTNFRGATHKVVLTESEINNINENVSNFLAKASCTDYQYKRRYINETDWWLRNGGASQSQSPICNDIRIIMISIDPDRKKPRERDNLSYVFYHEVYHSFQHDLTYNCRGPNDLWVIEAAASYFARYSVAMSNGASHKMFVNGLLDFALWHANNLGTKLEDPGVAEKGLGALRLMIEKGWLEESRVLDGSLFHDCARVKEFSDSDPKIQYLKDHWYKIENNNGNFEFNLSNGKGPSQNETIKTVNYDTNLMELCPEHIAHGWKSYVKINKKEYNSKGYLFAVVGEDGRCEHGFGPTQKHAFNDCTHWKKKNNIIGTCELYARGEEVVWRGVNGK